MDLVRELLERRRQVPDGNGLAQVQTRLCACLRYYQCFPLLQRTYWYCRLSGGVARGGLRHKREG